jgi:predicted ArsR family transcriptional regulator
MRQWTFLTNHAIVFVLLAKHPQITALELSRSSGITERRVRKIIADLEAENYIEKTKEGRRVRYQVDVNLPFRHQSQRDKAIGKLLEALGWKPKRGRGRK